MEFKWSHFAKELILWGVRWYVAYPISYRQLEEMMLERGVAVDHRAVKRVVRPMRGFKSFWAARCTIAGMEVMHAMRKGQLMTTGNVGQTPAEQFSALVA
jgi:transposase-like protein